ncbi:nucleotidyltransferase domain-containing protein [Parabacteroides distasonis]|nr:nucleotidyltransferase domain-containing protein [Parabacteroides distasonis]
MNQREVIDQIKEVAKQSLPPNANLLLYGSRARGDAHSSSDWDLLVILDKPNIEQQDYDDVLFPFTLLGWKLGEAIIPIAYTKKEWEATSFLPFHKQVEQDKIILA